MKIIHLILFFLVVILTLDLNQMFLWRYNISRLSRQMLKFFISLPDGMYRSGKVLDERLALQANIGMRR